MNFQKTKIIDILKKKNLNQRKNKYSLKKINSFTNTNKSKLALTKKKIKFVFLNLLKSNIIFKNILIKRKKNFEEIFFSFFHICQTPLVSFLFLNFFQCKQEKQETKSFICSLRKKFLKKKTNFAIFLFQFFLKTIKKSVKTFITLYFFHENILKRKDYFLLIQFFLELQFFFMLKKFQSFLVENNILQNKYLKALAAHCCACGKKQSFYSFLPQVNNIKLKIVNFYSLSHFQKNVYLNFFTKKQLSFVCTIVQIFYNKASQLCLTKTIEKFKNVFSFILKKKPLFCKKLFINQQKVIINVSPFNINMTCLLALLTKEKLDCYEAHKVQVKKKIQILKLDNLKRCQLCFPEQKLFQTELLLFQVWQFTYKNFYTAKYQINSKFVYRLNLQKKQETKICFLFSQNKMKVGKIFSLFFDFTKIYICKTFCLPKQPSVAFCCEAKPVLSHAACLRSKAKKQTEIPTTDRQMGFQRSSESCAYENQRIDYRFKDKKNIFLASKSQKLSKIVETYLISFPFSLQMLSFNNNDFLNKKHKRVFCLFLKFIKKNTLLFFEYFSLLNCLKKQIFFFQKLNNFQILFHQQLKYSIFCLYLLAAPVTPVTQSVTGVTDDATGNSSSTNLYFNKHKNPLQKFKNCDFFSFLQFFLIINSQKNKNDSFLNIFHQFFNLYFITKIENLYKINQIHLLKNFKKSFYKTNIKKFLKFFQKKLSSLTQKTFYSQRSQRKETNKMLLINQTRTFLLNVLFKFFYSYSNYFRKILFHLYQLEQVQNDFSKKYNFRFFQFSFFQNLCIKKKCFKNSILKPIYFIYNHYYENFVFFQCMICMFLKNKKVFKLMKSSFYKNVILNKRCFNNFEKNQLSILRNFPLIPLFQIFFLNISKKQKSTVQLLLFQKMFWIVSNKMKNKSTKLSKRTFFSFSAFFSSFLIKKSQKTILYRQINFRKNIFFRKNSFYLNFEGFAVYLNMVSKKKSKIFFVFQKKKTLQNTQIYLKQCQQILKKSIGKKQIFFMKKLQRKMKLWCQEFRNNVLNCQLDSSLTTLATKKTFHYCDSMFLKYLWSWARKTHPNKSKNWIQKKYFHFLHSKKWFFGKRVGKSFICLPLHSQTKI